MEINNKTLSNPPKDLKQIMTEEKLCELFRPLIGKPFVLTGKPRTDGATFRKMVSALLIANTKCESADATKYSIIPKRRKGVPRLLLELLDTYLVTTGDPYNLQVWNRIPNSVEHLVEYDSGETIVCKDIRFVLAKIDETNQSIESIIILSPMEIENNFGVFGKPTIKHQLLITDKKRVDILSKKMIITPSDSATMKTIVKNKYKKPSSKLSKYNKKDLLSIDVLNNKLSCLRGYKLSTSDTKTRGQLLERIVANLIGYDEKDALVGGYPDIPNQMLEVKVQDSPTIDLGAHSPRIKEIINLKDGIGTQDIRYLIALTNPTDGIIEDYILTCGEYLGNYFSYVSEKNFKCQRSIPMDYFIQQKGQCVVNPKYQ